MESLHRPSCSSITLKAKLAELHKTTEELKQAKDDAIESWLASIPLVDEFVKVEKDITIAKNHVNMSNIIVKQLESELESTRMSIKSKREDELEAKKMINQINDELEETQEETELITKETYEERRKRSQLKQVLLMRRQTLEALQLTQRAVKLELEAIRASAGEALEHINRSHDNATLQIDVEEYEALTNVADEEDSLMNWRVLAATEQRLAAHDSRELAFKRLDKLYYQKDDLKLEEIEEEIAGDVVTVGKQDGQEDSEVFEAGENGKLVNDEATPSSQPQLIDVSGSSRDEKEIMEGKKPSVFAHIRKFVANIV